jgi:uncharacterized protein
MKKLVFLFIVFLALTLLLGVIVKLAIRSIGLGEGLDAFAIEELILGLSTLIAYTVVFSNGAPHTLIKIGLSKKSAGYFFGAFISGALTVCLGFLLLLLFGGQARFSVTISACLFSLAAAVGIAMVEEVIFRGALFELLTCALPTGWTVLVVAVLFAIGHLDGRSDLALATTFLLGLAFTITVVQFKNLWIPIGLHAGTNFLTILASGIPGVHGGFVKFTGSQFRIEFTFLISAALLVLVIGITWIVLWLRQSEDQLVLSESQTQSNLTK